jgi:hypothetical protein
LASSNRLSVGLMFRWAISLLLLSSLVACPAWCWLGPRLSADDGGPIDDGVQACCPSHAPKPSPDSDGANRQPSTPCGDGPRDATCQCICAGAVIEQSGAEVVDRSAAGPVPAALPDNPSDATRFSQNTPISADHCTRVTPGRMICRLYARFLC